MFKILLALSFLLFVPACGQQTPTPRTPNIVVVTATAEANPGALPTIAPNTLPAATPNLASTPDTGSTTTVNLKPTDVKYVLAKQDINIRNGPGTNFKIVGGVFAGNTAQVTGFKSADDQWWRVVCPVDSSTDCWVSADTALTEPASAPNLGPTSTPTAGIGLSFFAKLSV
jgi:uncharacterized protein YgiM (DUF1202 family)